MLHRNFASLFVLTLAKHYLFFFKPIKSGATAAELFVHTIWQRHTAGEKGEMAKDGKKKSN